MKFVKDLIESAFIRLMLILIVIIFIDAGLIMPHHIDDVCPLILAEAA